MLKLRMCPSSMLQCCCPIVLQVMGVCSLSMMVEELCLAASFLTIPLTADMGTSGTNERNLHLPHVSKCDSFLKNTSLIRWEVSPACSRGWKWVILKVSSPPNHSESTTIPKLMVHICLCHCSYFAKCSPNEAVSLQLHIWLVRVVCF